MWSYVTVYFFKAGMAYVKKWKIRLAIYAESVSHEALFSRRFGGTISC